MLLDHVQVRAMFAGAGRVVCAGNCRTVELKAFLVSRRQAVNATMQKFGLKTTKSKRKRREAEAQEEAEAALQFKVNILTTSCLL